VCYGPEYERYVRIGFGGKGAERVPDGLHQLDRFSLQVASGEPIAAVTGG
jgi:hypothetical protein